MFQVALEIEIIRNESIHIYHILSCQRFHIPLFVNNPSPVLVFYGDLSVSRVVLIFICVHYYCVEFHPFILFIG